MPIITEMISAADLEVAVEEEEVATDPKSIPIMDSPAGSQRGMEPMPPAPPREPLPKPAPPPIQDEAPRRIVKAGDILEHQQFGRCEVQKCSADEEFVTVRLRNNRLVRLSLEVLDLQFEGLEEGGRQSFTSKPARR